jgi:PelA/Pel-15E family pectate lyase
VEAAAQWFERVKLADIRLLEVDDPSLPDSCNLVVGFDPTDVSLLWARFYEIGTNYPLFLDLEGNVYYALSQISHERRTGYDWLGDWPREFLTEQYPVWRERREDE